MGSLFFLAQTLYMQIVAVAQPDRRPRLVLETKEPTMSTTTYRAVQVSRPGRMEVVERELTAPAGEGPGHHLAVRLDVDPDLPRRAPSALAPPLPCGRACSPERRDRLSSTSSAPSFREQVSASGPAVPRPQFAYTRFGLKKTTTPYTAKNQGENQDAAS